MLRFRANDAKPMYHNPKMHILNTNIAELRRLIAQKYGRAILSKPILSSVISLCVYLTPQSMAWAQAIDIDREVQFFLVSGNNIDEIKKELTQKGPNGFWALTEWHVTWDDECNVEYRAVLTLPRLIFPNKLSDSDRTRVETVFKILKNHEDNHYRMGLFAAEEVKRNSCHEPSIIIEYWMDKNTEYDRQSANGRHEGIDFDQ